MLKRLLQAVAVMALLISFIPAQAFGDVSLVQDDCIPYFDQGKPHCTIYFSVVNAILTPDICDLHLVPEVVDPDDECRFVDCDSPAGWSCVVSGGSNSTLDYFANSPADCITAGTMKTGFEFDLDPDFCCYVVQFTGPTGAVILEQEECFIPCFPSGVGAGAWGMLKSIYR